MYHTPKARTRRTPQRKLLLWPYGHWEAYKRLTRTYGALHGQEWMYFFRLDLGTGQDDLQAAFYEMLRRGGG